LQPAVYQVYQALRTPPETQIGTHWGHIADGANDETQAR